MNTVTLPIDSDLMVHHGLRPAVRQMVLVLLLYEQVQRLGWRSKYADCSETIEPAYAERRTHRAIDKYAFQLSALLKTEAVKSRKQRRTLKQIHEDLKELGFDGSYDRVAAFARVWREGQI